MAVDIYADQPDYADGTAANISFVPGVLNTISVSGVSINLNDYLNPILNAAGTPIVAYAPAQAGGSSVVYTEAAPLTVYDFSGLSVAGLPIPVDFNEPNFGKITYGTTPSAAAAPGTYTTIVTVKVTAL